MGPGSNLKIPDWSPDIEECYTLEIGIHVQNVEKRSSYSNLQRDAFCPDNLRSLNNISNSPKAFISKTLGEFSL